MRKACQVLESFVDALNAHVDRSYIVGNILTSLKLHSGFGVAYEHVRSTRPETARCTSEDVYGLTRGKPSNALSKWCKIRRPMADSGIRHAVDIEASVLWCQHASMVAFAAPHLNDNSILDNSRLRNCHAIASQRLVTW